MKATCYHWKSNMEKTHIKYLTFGTELVNIYELRRENLSSGFVNNNGVESLHNRPLHICSM